MKQSIRHLSIIGEKTSWRTPGDILSNACYDFRVEPLLDPCADDNNSLEFKYFYRKQDDGLKQDWKYDAFVNPPYGREVGLWVKKAYEEHMKHNITVLMLVFSKTDTKWWHNYIQGLAEVHFIKGRLRFLEEDGSMSKYPAPYPSCWAIWRRL